MSNQLAVAPQYNELRGLMRREDTLARFQEILNTRASGFMATVLTAVYNSPQLQDADPASTLTASLQAAALDLSIDPNIGYAYLVPFSDKGVKKTQLQVGYKGFIQMAYRTQEYEVINVGELYEGEEIHEDRLSGAVAIVGRPVNDQVIGYFAYFKLKSGIEKYLYMTVDEIKAHAQRYSKSYGKNFSAWSTNFREMALKTVIKLLLKKWGPLSIDIRQALAADDAEPNGLASRPLVEPVDENDDRTTVIAEIETDEDGNERITAIEGDFRDAEQPEKVVRTDQEFWTLILVNLKWERKDGAELLKKHGGDFTAAYDAAAAQIPN